MAEKKKGLVEGKITEEALAQLRSRRRDEAAHSSRFGKPECV